VMMLSAVQSSILFSPLLTKKTLCAMFKAEFSSAFEQFQKS